MSCLTLLQCFIFTGNCYKRTEIETKEIQAKIDEKLGNNKPIENDVIVLYDGENLPDQVTWLKWTFMPIY